MKLASTVVTMAMVTSQLPSSCLAIKQQLEKAKDTNMHAENKDLEKSFRRALKGGDDKEKGSSVYNDALEKYKIDQCGITAEALCSKTFDGVDLKLTKDIVCNDVAGPTVVNGSTIDCNGFSIKCVGGRCSPNGYQPDMVGITLGGDANKVQVKNCRIDSFQEGVRVVTEGSDVIVDNIVTTDNVFGISISGGRNEIDLTNIVLKDLFSGISFNNAVDSKASMQNIFACEHNFADIYSINSAVAYSFLGNIVCGKCADIPDVEKVLCGNPNEICDNLM